MPAAKALVGKVNVTVPLRCRWSSDTFSQLAVGAHGPFQRASAAVGDLDGFVRNVGAPSGLQSERCSG